MKQNDNPYDSLCSTFNHEQIQRIVRMEELYDRGCAVTESLLQAMEGYRSLEQELKELETYYQDGRWMADFDADRAGAIPRDLKRGILTEDAIYDLLTDRHRMIQMMKEIVQAYEQEHA